VPAEEVAPDQDRGREREREPEPAHHPVRPRPPEREPDRREREQRDQVAVVAGASTPRCSSTGFYTFIRDYLNDFRIPVMVYMFVISVMAILAAYRYKRVNLLSFRLILFGALFFVISDAALAFNKFVEPYPFAGILIMSTYMIAQYLITMGAIERKVEEMK
jgi:hypothetical protein